MSSQSPRSEQQPEPRRGAKGTIVVVSGFFALAALLGAVIFPSPIWWLVAVLPPLGLYLILHRQTDIWAERMANGERYPMQSAESILERLGDARDRTTPS